MTDFVLFCVKISSKISIEIDHCWLIALKIFSVSKISDSRVALHLPSSSALRSTLDDLPILA